ncbi:MAG: L,D-transpeptidase family protein [Lactobacillales bacterium]|nr:L,D-transpeptidase family protein [Lactobacillales bacterium]
MSFKKILLGLGGTVILLAAAFVIFCAVAAPAFENPLPSGTVIDKIVIYKEKRELTAYHGDRELKTYKVALGFEPKGHKQFEGDGKTPEGIYKVDGKNPHSKYHKNLGVSYPNAADRAYAKKHGKRPGGDIKIHGLPNGLGFLKGLHLQKSDWTLGCIAVTNEEIDELYKYTAIGATVEIHP